MSSATVMQKGISILQVVFLISISNKSREHVLSLHSSYFNSIEISIYVMID